MHTDFETHRTANHRSVDNNGHAIVGHTLRNTNDIACHGVTASKQTVKEINQGFEDAKRKQKT